MSAEKLESLLASIRDAKVVEVGANLSPSMTLHCHIAPPIQWSVDEFENRLHVTLPRELIDLWNHAAELRLLDDVNYGQWGCVLWSPVEVVAKQARVVGPRSEDFRDGDLILGEFRGDSDLVILRCDPAQRDFGAVVIALPIDPRADWPQVADSLIEFIGRFLHCTEQKYWEIRA